MPSVPAESENDCSMAVLARGGELQILDFCGRISELLWVLLWVLLWPGLRNSFDREMAGDRIVRWRSRHESGMDSGSVGGNRKMILGSEKSRFCLSFSCFIHFYLPKWCGKKLSHGKLFVSFTSLRIHKTPYPVYKSLYVRICILTLLTKFRLHGVITESHRRLQAKLGNKHH